MIHRLGLRQLYSTCHGNLLVSPQYLILQTNVSWLCILTFLCLKGQHPKTCLLSGSESQIFSDTFRCHCRLIIVVIFFQVMVMHPAFMHYVHNTWLHIRSRRSYPSTGFLVLIFAMHICDEVKLLAITGLCAVY